MLVKQVMSQPLFPVRKDTPLEEVAQALLKSETGCAPVLDDKEAICGLITESAFLAKEKGVPFSTVSLPHLFDQCVDKDGFERRYRAARRITAEEVMESHPPSIDENISVNDAARLMFERRVNCILVIRDGMPVGAVTPRSFIRLLISQRQS